jgi:hypothetical protein
VPGEQSAVSGGISLALSWRVTPEREKHGGAAETRPEVLLGVDGIAANQVSSPEELG